MRKRFSNYFPLVFLLKNVARVLVQKGSWVDLHTKSTPTWSYICSAGSRCSCSDLKWVPRLTNEAAEYHMHYSDGRKFPAVHILTLLMHGVLDLCVGWCNLFKLACMLNIGTRSSRCGSCCRACWGCTEATRSFDATTSCCLQLSFNKCRLQIGAVCCGCNYTCSVSVSCCS